jgi:penicillin-binding protein 2
MYSKPGYDLNEMAGALSTERAQQLRTDPYRPLIDKTSYESYFPGSVFKVFSALAALEDHLLDPATTVFDCPGYYELGGRRFRCSEVHHKVDLRKALVRSCNVFFFHLAEQVGLDRLARIAKEFGLGAKTGVGINEANGFIPTRDWYLKRYNNRYRLGFTLNETIGQGNTRVTLVQLALAYAAIANGGTLYVPQLVKAIKAPNGDTIERFEPRVRRRIAVDRKNLAYLIDALFGVVNDQGGTAFDARVEGGIPVAGKTGTAQVAVRNPAASIDDPKQAWIFNRSHAWFVGFAPAQEPELVVAVLVEHGGPGGKYAAPIAIQILNDALKKPTQE